VRGNDDLRLPWWARIAGVLLALVALALTLPVPVLRAVSDLVRGRLRPR
jgi:hypothetical protein